jgi:feruloyl esterase
MLRCPSPLVTPPSPKRLRVAAASVVLLAGCGGGSGGGGFLPFVPAPAPAPAPAALACDESLKTAFKPDANTTVTLVRQFKKGDHLNLNGTPSGNTAAGDLCLVKLNVGPGNPGPADAPSTSPGIGIEVWLPAKAAWNNRLHVLGGGGFVGDPSISALDRIGASGGGDSPARVAGTDGSVSAITDAGHRSSSPASVLDGSFAMKPDGTINTTLWNDFASRGIHEMSVKAKALATGFYGQAPKYAYWDGCSTGGRQGHMEAQVHPEDFDGILAGNSATNWTTFITSELYPQIVMQRDLGAPIPPAQLTLASARAVKPNAPSSASSSGSSRTRSPPYCCTLCRRRSRSSGSRSASVAPATG